MDDTILNNPILRLS